MGAAEKDAPAHPRSWSSNARTAPAAVGPAEAEFQEEHSLLLTFPEGQLETAFREDCAAQRVSRDSICHALGIGLWLTVGVKLYRSGRQMDLLLAACGATQSSAALLLWCFLPGRYLRWRDYINTAIKLSSIYIGICQGILPLGIQPGSWAALLIPECVVWNKVMMLIFISLGMPLIFSHHLWVHALATAIVMTGNRTLCTLAEAEIPGSLSLFNDALTLVSHAGIPVLDGLVPPVTSRLGPEASCVAVQSSLQILLGFFLPTIMLYLWETAARDVFLGRALPPAGYNLANTLEWLLLPSILVYLGPATIAISSAVVGWM